MFTFFWVVCDILTYNFYVEKKYFNYPLPWFHEKLCLFMEIKKIKLAVARKIMNIMIKVHEYD